MIDHHGYVFYGTSTKIVQEIQKIQQKNSTKIYKMIITCISAQNAAHRKIQKNF
ncbi:MAG: hypothetical protein ACOZBG_02965 [Candidatus Micrarchaeota archaeon]